MRCLISAVILFFAANTFAQKMTYAEWKEAAKTEMRLLPKYGNIPKTKEQKKSDQQLIASYLAQAGTPRKASDLLVKLGFDYLYRKDLRTAMYRFNQAWLLDPTNENVFWGFGSIYFSFQDFKQAMVQYDEGLKLNPKSSNILTDKATIHMTNYINNHNEKDLGLTLQYFRQSYAIDPTNQNTLYKMSVSYFMHNDCSNAWKYYKECQKQGGKPITKEYTQALTQKCKQ